MSSGLLIVCPARQMPGVMQLLIEMNVFICTMYAIQFFVTQSRRFLCRPQLGHCVHCTNEPAHSPAIQGLRDTTAVGSTHAPVPRSAPRVSCKRSAQLAAMQLPVHHVPFFAARGSSRPLIGWRHIGGCVQWVYDADIRHGFM